MADRLTHEEHILYLMIELDQALARQKRRDRGSGTGWTTLRGGWRSKRLLERLLAIIPRS